MLAVAGEMLRLHGGLGVVVHVRVRLHVERRLQDWHRVSPWGVRWRGRLRLPGVDLASRGQGALWRLRRIFERGLAPSSFSSKLARNVPGSRRAGLGGAWPLALAAGGAAMGAGSLGRIRLHWRCCRHGWRQRHCCVHRYVRVLDHRRRRAGGRWYACGQHLGRSRPRSCRCRARGGGRCCAARREWLVAPGRGRRIPGRLCLDSGRAPRD
mmetsp:Transcript_68048/g.199148  ORF Transcript_68048/g.199148 Transcript_68048/m.199148 type:complete len:211 (+) Transcript_68048:275-907(+)